MVEFARIGTRYINLDNIAEVRINPNMKTAFVFYCGGGSMELKDDEADDLRTFLDQKAMSVDESHRRVFTPTS